MTDLVAGRPGPGGSAGRGGSEVGETGGQGAGGLSDSGLVIAMGRGRVEAMAEVYGRHGPSVYRVACQLLGLARAEEVTREVFVNLWRAPEAFDPTRGSLRAHLIAGVDSRASEAPDPEATAGGVGEEAWRLLAGLPEAERQAIVLACLAGWTLRQVAARLDRREEAVGADIRAGLRTLRQGLSVPGRDASAHAIGE